MKTIKTSPYIPTNVQVDDISDNRVQISAFPFESGYGITLAHPIRRLLLSSSVGTAPIALKIEGVSHEFDSIRGIVEDVSPFIVNLKQVRFLGKEELTESVVLDYTFEGPMVLKAKHLENDSVGVINKEQVLATINEDATLNFSIIVQNGIGYVPSESIRDLIPQGYIPLDAYFTPVRKATYDIENILVEGDPTYEKVVFDIETDGQIKPFLAFKEAVMVLHSQMSVFSDNISSAECSRGYDEVANLNQLLTKIEALNLSARCFNSLDKAGILYVGELVLMGGIELKKIKNMGSKSYDEVAEKLANLGFPVDSKLDSEMASTLHKKISSLKGTL